MQHHSHLLELMNFAHKRNCASTTTWDSQVFACLFEEIDNDKRNSTLLSFCCSAHLMADIKPNNVCKWMTFKACGKEDPSQEDHPVKRAASIECWKKAISCFFHTTQKWNENSQTGNPTQSTMVNALIKVVKKQETRGNGAESQKDRPFTEDECHQILELLRGRDDARTTAMINFQHHLMAGMDDVAHVRKVQLKVGLNLI